MNALRKVWLFSLIAALLLCGCSSEEKKKAKYFEKGKAYYEKGEYDSARIELENALKIDPKYQDALLYMGRNAVKLNDPKRAFGSYFNLERLQPDNMEAKTHLATFFFSGQKIR
ncbi:MAG: tetratricopeptide repeat protein [Desulfobacteraceae bacterium]|nr:tetratricopeptide repeat protein [Desulfobacteraceae bacterium]